MFIHVLQPATYPNVPTKRREHTPDSSQPAEVHCVRKLIELQKQVGFLRFRLEDVEHIDLNDQMQRRVFKSLQSSSTL